MRINLIILSNFQWHSKNYRTKLRLLRIVIKCSCLMSRGISWHFPACTFTLVKILLAISWRFHIVSSAWNALCPHLLNFSISIFPSQKLSLRHWSEIGWLINPLLPKRILGAYLYFSIYCAIWQLYFTWVTLLGNETPKDRKRVLSLSLSPPSHLPSQSCI